VMILNEMRKRSTAKAITYRVICISMLALVTYVVTRDIMKMTSIVVIFQSIQMIIYYFHERTWERVEWGRNLSK
jgi:uncharacterized membrane protein